MLGSMHIGLNVTFFVHGDVVEESGEKEGGVGKKTRKMHKRMRRRAELRR